MSLNDCLDAGFTEPQCKFLLRPRAPATPPTTIESIDDFLQLPQSDDFVQTLTEANSSEATEALSPSIKLGRLHCAPIGGGMFMCTM